MNKDTVLRTVIYDQQLSSEARYMFFGIVDNIDWRVWQKRFRSEATLYRHFVDIGTSMGLSPADAASAITELADNDVIAIEATTPTPMYELTVVGADQS